MNYCSQPRFQSTSLVLFCVLTVLTPCASWAQSADLQNWRGPLEVKLGGVVVQNIDLQLLLETGTQSGDSQMVTVNQKGIGVPLDDISLEEDTVKFKVKAMGVEFEGKLNEAKDELSGTYKQGVVKAPLILKHESTAKHTSTKTGIMKFGGKPYDFQFRFFTDENGKQIALLDSFSENLGSLICQVKEKDGILEIVIPNSKAKFVGKVDNGNAVVGRWIQGKLKVPLTLTNVDLVETRELGQQSAKLNRRQNPKPPFPYEVEEFSVSLQKVNPNSPPISIAGTLTIPQGDGPFPGAILISGSGPQDRDSTIVGHKPFWVIADHLSRNGFAVLRYDERGVGKSTGDFGLADSTDLAADAEALFTWLGENPKIASRKIALIGHSEGGYIAPMIAARNPHVAAVVSLAGPGVTGRRTSTFQSSNISKAMGASEETLEFNQAFNTAIFDRMESGKPFDKSFKEKLRVEMKALWKDKLKTEMPKDLLESAFTAGSSPWTMFFVSYDPAVDLAKTKCPFLCLIGEKDTQVDADLNVPVIEAALKKSGNNDFEIKRLPNLNHLFQNAKTGQTDEYGKIEETFDPGALKLMTNWLIERLK